MKSLETNEKKLNLNYCNVDMLLPDQTYEQACHIPAATDYKSYDRLAALKKIIQSSNDGGHFIKTTKSTTGFGGVIGDTTNYVKNHEIFGHRKNITDDSESESETETDTDDDEDDDDDDDDEDDDDDVEAYSVFEEEIILPAPHQEKPADPKKVFAKTCEFFDNIPEYRGDPLGPFSIPLRKERNTSQKTNPNILKECESYLTKYRIRPEFFCRYRKAME